MKDLKFKIEDDFDIPLIHKYPFDKMDIGDCFLIPKPFPLHRHAWAIQLSVSSCAKRFSQKHKDGQWKFITRRMEEGIRVWRIQ